MREQELLEKLEREVYETKLKTLIDARNHIAEEAKEIRDEIPVLRAKFPEPEKSDTQLHERWVFWQKHLKDMETMAEESEAKVKEMDEALGTGANSN